MPRLSALQYVIPRQLDMAEASRIQTILGNLPISLGRVHRSPHILKGIQYNPCRMPVDQHRSDPSWVSMRDCRWRAAQIMGTREETTLTA